MRRITLLALVIAMACSTAYQPSGSTGGFSQTQLSPSLYHVRFVGNGYTSEERAAEFFLRRCAEIALENGRRYFRIQDEQRSSPNAWDTTRVRAGTLYLLDSTEADAADAVVVIRQTDTLASGRLSTKAAEQLKLIESGN